MYAVEGAQRINAGGEAHRAANDGVRSLGAGEGGVEEIHRGRTLAPRGDSGEPGLCGGVRGVPAAGGSVLTAENAENTKNNKQNKQYAFQNDERLFPPRP